MLDSGRFDGPIGRHPKNRVKMTVRDDGKEARTDWRVAKRFEEGLTLIECIIHSGGPIKLEFIFQMPVIHSLGTLHMDLNHLGIQS